MSRTRTLTILPASSDRTASTERLFCSKPFTWFEVSRGELRGEGDTYLCCPSWLPTPVGNLLEQTVEEVWNGEPAQAIRRSILDGSFSYCDDRHCPYLQTISGPVQRAADVRDPLLRAVIDDGLLVLPYGPLELNCSYDRSCNLSCPSCRTGIIVESQSRDRIEHIQSALTEQALGGARLLYITGSGDPFGSPFFRRWLQTMRRADMPNMEVIYLHTNAQLWTPRMWETIPEDVRALVKDAQISIDAASPGTYAINRRGGKFETLLENLAFIRMLRESGQLRWLGFNMVVQDNNFAEMPEFVRLGQRFGADTVSFQQLTNWGTFTDAEFEARAVHRPEHPRNRELGRVLAHPLLYDPIAQLGNLTETRQRLVPDGLRGTLQRLRGRLQRAG